VQNRIARYGKYLIKDFLCALHGISNHGENVYISPWAKIKNGKKLSLGNNVGIQAKAELIIEFRDSWISIGDATYIFGYSQLNTYNGWIKIGNNCTINRFAILYGHGGLEIGNDVMIAPNVMIFPQNHIFQDTDVLIREQGISCVGIKIEDNVWLGAGAIILDRVTIGEGAVIGAGSVVTKDIPPYSIATGVPARVIKKRGKKIQKI